jgi:hypothetical protein
MLNDVKLRLAALGYTFVDADSWVLGYIIQKVEGHIKNQCNTLTVPEGLYQNAVEMVCGEFLLGKKGSGQLVGFDLDAAVKSIQEGDTNVSFAFGSGSKTPEERLDGLINFLLHSEVDYSSYRKIRW